MYLIKLFDSLSLNFKHKVFVLIRAAEHIW